MAKKRNLNDLPPDLKKPIRVDQILAETNKRRRAGLDHHGILSAELRRRVELMARYLGIQWPKNEDGWLKLVVGICSRWNVPGFRFATILPSGARARAREIIEEFPIGSTNRRARCRMGRAACPRMRRLPL
jgi:hypothetical protein